MLECYLISLESHLLYHVSYIICLTIVVIGHHTVYLKTLMFGESNSSNQNNLINAQGYV